MYAKICYDCLEKHQDIIDKKVSKGCFVGFTSTKNSDECCLDFMHEPKEVVEEGKMKVGFQRPDKWIYETGLIDLKGYSNLNALLNSSRWVQIEIEDTVHQVNTDKLLSVWEYKEKEVGAE